MRKSGNASKLKNCVVVVFWWVTSPGVVLGREAPLWDGKVTEEFTRNTHLSPANSL